MKTPIDKMHESMGCGKFIIEIRVVQRIMALLIITQWVPNLLYFCSLINTFKNYQLSSDIVEVVCRLSAFYSLKGLAVMSLSTFAS